MVDFQPVNGYNTAMYYRSITSNLLAALTDTPVVLLTGARQTGKSTLARWLATHQYPAQYLTLDDAAVLAAARHDPAGFIAGMQGNVVLDEIQRVPELFMAIKATVDRHRAPGRFLLTGSTNVMVLPQLSEALAGRVEIQTLRPLSQGELEGVQEGFIDAAFAAEAPEFITSREGRAQLLRRAVTGGYPEILQRAAAPRRSAWFGSYITTILQRDVRDLAHIDGLTTMPKLLSLLAARSCALLNFAELSRSIGLPQTTLKRYMSLLEMTFLIYLLPAWSGNLIRRHVKAPKLFMCDTGLAAHLLGIDETGAGGESRIIGGVLENFVLVELLKQASWSSTHPRIYHFRTQTGNGVDFIMENAAGRVVGIEVKASVTLKENDYRGLQELSDMLGKKFHRGILLYTGSESIAFGKNLFAMPLQALWRTAAKKTGRSMKI